MKNNKLKILISSNCQTGGIASSLNILLRNSILSIEAAPIHHNTSENERLKISQLLNEVDFWVTSFGWDFPEIKESCETNIKLKVIKIPAITFSAFHPDLSYVIDRRSNQILSDQFAYNSAIAVWLFNNNINITNAKYFFNAAVFNALGYTHMWDSSSKQLLNEFISLGLTITEFEEFFNAVKRYGCFMHSINHPSIDLLFELSKLVAKKIDPSLKLEKFNTTIADPLMLNSIWPLYPDIADSLGLEGSYIWKLNDGKLINGLDSFLLESFTYYENNYERGYLELKNFPIPSDKFNTVMNSLNLKINH